MLLSIALLTGSALTLVACETSPPKLTPVELAEQHIKEHIEIHSNTIAAFAVRDLPVAKDVLGEYVERQVHKLVKWQYVETDYLGDDLYMVTASASVSIPVDVQVEQLGTRITGQIYVMLPLDVTVDHAAQTGANRWADIQRGHGQRQSAWVGRGAKAGGAGVDRIGR